MSPLARTVAAVVFSAIACTALADECASGIPAALQAALDARHETFTLPRAADSDSLCVADRRRAGQSGCLLVTHGDFDGDGKEDVAIVRPSSPPGRGWQFLVALDRSSSWDIEVVATSRVGGARHLMLSPLPAGEYRETEAVLAPGETRRRIRSTHPAPMLAGCDSWATGYFRVDGRWTPLPLSD